jgi:hypothetical protein
MLTFGYFKQNRDDFVLTLEIGEKFLEKDRIRLYCDHFLSAFPQKE